MSIGVMNAQVREYLNAVAAALHDVPQAERDELLDDLEQHLIEVAAEDDGTLVERLGAPEAYAEELRASAGLSRRASEEDQFVDRVRARLARSAIVRFVARAATHRFARAAREFAPEVAPGWWVARGYVLIAGLAFINESHFSGITDVFIPSVLGSHAFGLGAIAFGIWLSVRIGRRNREDASGLKILSLALSAATLLVAFVATSNAEARVNAIRYSGIYSYTPEYLQHSDGSPIANICPYTADGNLLADVLLFDQNGRPIRDVARFDDVVVIVPSPSGSSEQPAAGDGSGKTDNVAELRARAGGASNAYPRTRAVADPETGEPVLVPCPMTSDPAP